MRAVGNAMEELRALILRLHNSPGRGSWLPGMQVMASTKVTQPISSVTAPTLALIAGGAKSTALAGREFRHRAGQYLVTTLALPVSAHVTRADPFLAFGLRLRPELIVELLPDAPARTPARPGPGMAVADADDDLLEPVVRLLRLVERPRDFAVLAPAVEREIHWRLLTGPVAGLVQQIGHADSHVSLVGRAVRWITDHFDQTIRIADLAGHVGVSVPTLNRRFRATTGMSPLQYQKQIRLQRARIHLAAAPRDVAGAGFAVGYNSPSQFSREYRRMFGSPPSDDAGRAVVEPAR
jgi:AraC-like DNA-binding protein